MEYIPNSWNFGETFRIFRLLLIFSSSPSDSYLLAFLLFYFKTSADPFLANVAVIVFIYYTSVVRIVLILIYFCLTIAGCRCSGR